MPKKLTPEFIKMLNSDGESEKIERKLIFQCHQDKRAEAVRDLIAMSNTHSEEDGYILIGISNDGKFVGIVSSVDSDIYEQALNTLIDPRVDFRYQEVFVDGVLIGIITVPFSQERFHIVSRDFSYKNIPYSSLRKGETWIRHLTGKRVPTSLDYRRMKQVYVRDSQPQPRLAVEFRNEDDTLKITADWQEVSPGNTSRSGKFNLDFWIYNGGECGAQNVDVFIKVPLAIKVTLSSDRNDENLSTKTSVYTPDNEISVVASQLTHGIYIATSDLSFEVQKSGTYSLKWTAYASNMRESTSGTLELIVKRPVKRT